MEESYYAAAQRDTLHNILSYSFELKYLILGHASTFQGMYPYRPVLEVGRYTLVHSNSSSIF